MPIERFREKSKQSTGLYHVYCLLLFSLVQFGISLRTISNNEKNRMSTQRRSYSIYGSIKWKGLALVSVLAGLFIHEARAQKPRSITDTTFSIREVVIVEQRKPVEVAKIVVPLKYTPVSISSTNSRVFQQQSIDNVNDALRNVTGIKPVVTYGGFQTFYMRGFGSPVMMVDGQRDERMNYSSSAPVADLTCVESIELLKGPSSVLYGHSAVGGILNIVRKNPTEENHADALISYGSWNSKRATFGASGKLAKGVSYRTDIGISNRDGWRENHDERMSSYFAFGFDLSNRDRLELRLGYVNDLYGTEAGIPTIGYDVHNIDGTLILKKNTVPSFISRKQRFNDPADFLKNKDYNATLRYKHRFSENLTLSNTFSAFKNDINYFSTESLSFLTSQKPIYSTFYEKNGVRTYVSLDTIQRDSPLRFSHMTQTLQNQLEVAWTLKTGNVSHSILGGWSSMILDRTSYTGYNNGVDVYGPGYLSKINTISPVLNQGALLSKFSKANPRKDYTNGLYVQDLIGITSQLKGMLAARLDFFKFETAGSVSTINGKREYLHSNLKWEKSSNISFTYRAGLVYLPVESLSLYTSYASFFKPYRDVLNSTYIYVNKDGKVFTPKAGEEIFKPENGYQAEVGLRYDFDKYVRVNASAFYIHKENIRENVATVTETVNGAPIKKKVMAQVGVVNSKGFDAEIQLTPIKQLAINAGYTFTEAEYGDFKSNPYINGDSRKGNQQVYSPKHLAFANVNYQFDSGILKSLTIGAGVNVSSKSYTNATNSIYLPSYVVVNTFASYRINEGLKVSVAAKNVFDKTYYEWALNNSQFIPSEGSNFLVSLSYFF